MLWLITLSNEWFILATDLYPCLTLLRRNAISLLTLNVCDNLRYCLVGVVSFLGRRYGNGRPSWTCWHFLCRSSLGSRCQSTWWATPVSVGTFISNVFCRLCIYPLYQRLLTRQERLLNHPLGSQLSVSTTRCEIPGEFSSFRGTIVSIHGSPSFFKLWRVRVACYSTF